MMKLSEQISNWLSEYLNKHELESFIIGVSGGIDSAVTSTLCAMTGHHTIVVIMPINQNQSETDRGRLHCEWLSRKYSNVQSFEKDLSTIYEEIVNLFPPTYSPLSLANSKARLRMISLYLIAGNHKGIVVGTGNKVEDFGIGFFTKYGDGGVDICPIADLLKTEVYELAREFKIIDSILLADPTDGLWEDGRTDYDQIGLSYEKIEWAMDYYENNDMKNIDTLSDEQKDILMVYKQHRKTNFHKIDKIPIFKKNR